MVQEGVELKDKGNEKFCPLISIRKSTPLRNRQLISMVQEGVELKDKGNEKFKAGEYAEAAVFYRKGLYYASFDDSQVCPTLVNFRTSTPPQKRQLNIA